MNLKVFAIVATAVLALGMLATTNILQQPVMAKNNDKCFSSESKDDTSHLRVCFAEDKATDKQLKDAKRECKETTDNKEGRCSSSQTTHGFFDNSKAP